ncbi:TetR/AcrR family transcriptional regulator [Oceanicella sp. SM1341]|uniref:TetR/AcrR family transcriptional regulator n=1 Tax=Oceanicella sp. SM1341 TaxID=1548889 RepID=UPI000E4A8933|nr:TetR/AcrR family transcriptional regulator [Oceanicella sp. SM1341]
MTKEARRAQLLDTAHALVRERGTDALTLGALAERAGVSKPVTYNHFGTRSGLMIALYKEINDRQVRALAGALERAPASLEEVAGLVSAAYMACHAGVGPEWHAIGAALKGDAAMERYQREMIDEYARFYAAALAPLSPLPAAELDRRCIAVIGAAEALSDAMVRGRLLEAEAAAELASLITAWLGGPPA